MWRGKPKWNNGGTIHCVEETEEERSGIVRSWKKTTDFININIMNNNSITLITPYLSTFDLNFLSLCNEKIFKYFNGS